eukprot:PhM_4_TR3094/c1_g1_i1/m.106797
MSTASNSPMNSPKSNDDTTIPTSAKKNASLAAGLYPYDKMQRIDSPETSSLELPPHNVRIFLGGLRFSMDKELVARAMAFLCGGETISPSDVVLFQKEIVRGGRPVKVNGGSGIVHVKDLDAAHRLVAYNKRVICEEHGVRVLSENSAAISMSRGNNNNNNNNSKNSAPHPMVIEIARPRRPDAPSNKPDGVSTSHSNVSPSAQPNGVAMQQSQHQPVFYNIAPGGAMMVPTNMYDATSPQQQVLYPVIIPQQQQQHQQPLYVMPQQSQQAMPQFVQQGGGFVMMQPAQQQQAGQYTVMASAPPNAGGYVVTGGASGSYPQQPQPGSNYVFLQH